MKINVREARHHPEFEPFMVYNDKPGCTGTLYFESYLQKEPMAIKLASMNPEGYYAKLLMNDKNDPEARIIKVKKGGFARLPHALFKVNSSDNSPCTYSQRALKDM